MKDLITITGAPASWRLGRTARRITRALRQAHLVPKSSSVVVSISCVGAREMTTLNAKYRRKRRPTDVLSFEHTSRSLAPRGFVFLGDVVLCIPVTRRQARERGHGVRVEAAILLVHGILHLLGFDHEKSPAAAREMALAESRLSRLAGLKAAGLIKRHAIKSLK